MEDKIIDDLDVDFMREILGPADLQIGDNLVRDIMTEYNNACNSGVEGGGMTQWNPAMSSASLMHQPSDQQHETTFIIQNGGHHIGMQHQHQQQHQFFIDNSNNINNQMNHQQQQQVYHHNNHHSQIGIVNSMSLANNGPSGGGFVMSQQSSVEFNPQSVSNYTTLDFSIQPGAAQMMLSNTNHHHNQHHHHHQILPSNSPPAALLQQQTTTFTTMNSSGTSFQTNNGSQMMNLTSQQQQHPAATSIQLDAPMPPCSNSSNNNRRVRKNLKDMLKEKDSALNTNTMMLNQQDQNMLFAPHHQIHQPHQILVHPSSGGQQHFNHVIDQTNMNSSELFCIPSSNSTPSPASIKLMMSPPSAGTSSNSSGTPPPLITGIQKVPSSPPSLASLSSSTMMANDLKQSPPPSFVMPVATVSTLAEQKQKSNKSKSSSAESSGGSKSKAAKSSASKENVANAGPPLTAKRNKVSKRTSHNAIEKKYRSSINDKINELKNRVAGPNIKLQKSGILRKALEHLNMVDDTIKNLKTENGSYRTALNAIRLQLNSAQTETLILQNIQNIVNSIPAEFHTRQYPNVLTPPGSSSPNASSSMSDYSQFSSGENSNSSSNDSFSSSESPSSSSPPLQSSSTPSYKKLKKEPMSDASRVFLCMFVMSVLFFNPFNLIFNNNNSVGGGGQNDGQYMMAQSAGQHLNSRVLNWFRTNSESIDNATLSSRRPDSGYFTTQTLVSWSLNIVLVVFCLLKLYLKSEPAIERDLSIDKIWLVYQRASKSFQRRMYDESFGWLERGLNELGHSVPRTKWQLMFGIVWQLTRVALNSFFTRLAAMNIRWSTREKTTSDERRRQVFKVYKLSALFYYEASKFGYLNMHSEKDFTPRTTLEDEESGNSGINNNNKSDSKSTNGQTSHTPLRLTITPYSYLMSIYFMLANYNMCEIYTMEHHKPDMTSRDEYNLCEYYMSTSLYLSLFLPSRLSRSIIKYMLKKKLAPKLKSLDSDESTSTGSKEKDGHKIRSLLRKSLFINYMINFDIYSNLKSSSSSSEHDRLRLLNMLSFKRRVFKSTESFLYSADDSASYMESKEQSSSIRGSGDYGVAISFVVAKFQDFLLYKMTGHILAAQSQMVRSERILKRGGDGHGKPLIDAVDAVTTHKVKNNSSSRSRRSKLDDLDEQQREQADVDQIKFERVMNLYTRNLDTTTNGDAAVVILSPQQETHLLLVEFLAMLNNWKLRNFDARSNSGHIREKLFSERPMSESSSPFVEAIRSVLRAHECIATRRPYDESLKHCRHAINSIKAFDHSFNAYSPNYYLVEKFELLIYDWILSAQTHIWTEESRFELELYNECLSKYQDLVVNLFPNLSSKVKMYQTVMLCLTNRNPISLLNATSKQSTFAKCNQEALFSINTILRNFHLHLVD